MRAQLTSAQARLREKEATALKAARDVDRLKGLVAKEKIGRQDDAAVAASDAGAANRRTRRGGTSPPPRPAIATAEGRLRQARAGVAQSQAALQEAKTAPQQLKVTQAKADMAHARVMQAESALHHWRRRISSARRSRRHRRES